MKTQSIGLSFLFILASLFTAHAQKGNISALKNENIKVWGECGMCKKKIETASKNAGAASADWNEDSKVLAVSFNLSKTNATKIQQAVAAAGYDTKDMTATEEAYNKLPGCCHYERKETAKQIVANCCKDDATCSKDQSCCKDGKCDKSSAEAMAACKEKGCCKS